MVARSGVKPAGNGKLPRTIAGPPIDRLTGASVTVVSAPRADRPATTS